ncbi:MAG TPA: hypothetical protein VLL48_02265, partial [Longimicrobiales bacterium]|nr:hypothetical protein [Longimicrobiales bacterium]
ACTDAPAREAGRVLLGAEARLGDGSVRTFARLGDEGAPLALGVVFPADVLGSLPRERTDTHRCFDLDGDGAIESDTECLSNHERVLPLPSDVSRRPDIPFKWVLLNWNPVGHIPPHVYDRPHFDVHFYMDAIENAFALIPGPCGPELLRCDQFERAMRPVPSIYAPAEFRNVEAAVPAMGNHLIDVDGPEFHGTPFTRTWIYGAYDGRVTFWEEMVTLEFLASRPDRCFDLRTPQAYEIGGWYPTKVCYRHDAGTEEQAVTLEGFVRREATLRVASGS